MNDKFTGGGLDWVIRAAYEQGLKDGAAAEREACVNLCEDVGENDSGRVHIMAFSCAQAIRARGDK